MHKILERIKEIGIVPVIKIENAKDAVPLAKALYEGGIPVAEVTFRTASAAEAIKNISQGFPEMLLGAGTVTTTDQVDSAVAAGAAFIVSPGLNPKVVSYCIEKGVLIVPGTCTPSEMEAAMELGLHTVKFFPAAQAGGVDFLKAVSGPYPELTFMPTGGINESNIGEYLQFSKIVACGGSWMVKPELIDAGNFQEITRLTKEAVAAVKKYRK